MIARRPNACTKKGETRKKMSSARQTRRCACPSPGLTNQFSSVTYMMSNLSRSRRGNDISPTNHTMHRSLLPTFGSTSTERFCVDKPQTKPGRAQVAKQRRVDLLKPFRKSAVLFLAKLRYFPIRDFSIGFQERPVEAPDSLSTYYGWRGRHKKNNPPSRTKNTRIKHDKTLENQHQPIRDSEWSPSAKTL